jgi:transcriptional regulator with XRE-family HTH domain
MRCGAALRSSNPNALCDPCGRSGSELEPALPPDFYDRDTVVRALRQYDFGGFFKSARRELGLSQEAFGLLIGLEQSRVCKIESATQRLRDITTIARLARALHIPAARLGFTADLLAILDEDHSNQAVSWVDRRDFLSTVTCIALGATGAASIHDRLTELVPAVRPEPPTRVGQADVDRIEATSRAFRDWDNRWGGGLSRAAVIAQLQWVVATGRSASCATEHVRTQLLVATADLASIAAWSSYDIEHHDEARRLWIMALDAAKEADNADLVGSVLRQLAHQALHLDRPDEGLRLLRLAYATTADPRHGVSELALANTAAYEAWCYAAGGSPAACDRALGKAEDHFDNARSEDAPPWLSHFDHAELQAIRGHVYHVLANHQPAAAARAEPLLKQAIAGRRPGYDRSKTLNLIALSATYFQRDDGLEDGIAVGRQALVGAGTLTSPRSLSRLRGLDAITAPYAQRPDVADFRHDLALALADAA